MFNNFFLDLLFISKKTHNFPLSFLLHVKLTKESTNKMIIYILVWSCAELVVILRKLFKNEMKQNDLRNNKKVSWSFVSFNPEMIYDHYNQVIDENYTKILYKILSNSQNNKQMVHIESSLTFCGKSAEGIWRA